MLVSSLCGAGRRTSSGTNHPVRVNTVTRKTTLGSPRMKKIRKVSSTPSVQGHGHSYGYLSKLTIVAVHTNATNCALLKKLMVPQLAKKFPSFYETRMFITALIKSHHFSHINPVHSQTISLRWILILLYNLRRGLPSGYFPTCFLTETLYEYLLLPTRATGTIQLFLLDMITCITFGAEYKS
jgi:hypothetical protein